MVQCNKGKKMRYVGHIHRLYLMLQNKEENLPKNELIDRIYELMNKNPEIIGGITRIEIEQAIECRFGKI